MIDTTTFQNQQGHHEEYLNPLIGLKAIHPAEEDASTQHSPDTCDEDCSLSHASTVDTRSRTSNLFTLKDTCLVGACTMTVTGESPLYDWSISGRMDVLGGRAILRNGKGKMLAVVLREKHGYLILSPKPLYEGQPQHGMQIRKKEMYLWVTVQERRFSSKLHLEVEGGPSLEVDVSGKYFGRAGARITEAESGKPCGMIRHKFEKGHVSESQWEIVKSSSRSPQVLICLAAIINRSMGRIVYADNHI